MDFAYGTITPYGRASQLVLLSSDLVTPWDYAHLPAHSRNPDQATRAAYTLVGLGSSPFARRY